MVVSIGGFLLGFDGSVISGAVPFYKNSLELADNAWLLGFSVSSIIFGSILGNFLAGPFSDRVGRKRALIATSILFFSSALMTALAPNVDLFIAGRILGGIGVGIAILVAPIYIAELAPPKRRGRLVTFNQLNIVLGLSAAYFTNYFILNAIPDPELNWRWMLGLEMVPAVIYLLLLLLVPESPRWLIQHGQDEEARQIMTKAGGTAHADREYENIRTSLAADGQIQKASYGELFSRKMSRVLIIGFALAFFQQASGINAVLYYAPLIFETAGGGRDAAFLQAVIVGLVLVGSTIVSMFLIDRLGRKMLLIIGTIIMTISLLLVSYAFNEARYTVTLPVIDNISDEVINQAVVEQATISDPRNYQFDEIFRDVDNAFLLRGGQRIAQVSMVSDAMIQAERRVTNLRRVLRKFKDRAFSSEVEFFNTMKSALAEAKDDNFNSYKDIFLKQTIAINATLVLIGILGFIAGFSISLGPVMWALFSEIFPNRLRGLAISVVGTFNAFTSWMVATVFPVELEVLGSSITYLIFAGAMLLCLFFVLGFVVETKGKTLEELERELVR